MHDPSYIRAVALHARRTHPAGETQDALLTGLMADAMIALRRDRGAATREALTRDCGFTADELDRLGERAKDQAATRWHGRLPAPACAA